MAKDTFYFSHDYDPTGDPKMSAMLSDYGGLGYGLFWRIVEMLHADQKHKLPLKKYVYQAVAKQMLDTKKIKLPIKDLVKFIEQFINDCIEVYELFIEANEANEALLQANEANTSASYFASSRVFRNIGDRGQKKMSKSDAGRLGGIKSGESRRKENHIEANEANEAVLQANEANEAKERKGNNILYTKETNDFVCFDAEEFLLGNQIIFEKICMATGKLPDEVKTHIHKYHLWMSKKEKYPVGKKAIEAWIEDWILNEKKFNQKYDGQKSTNTSDKLGTSAARTAALEKWAIGGKTSDSP